MTEPSSWENCGALGGTRTPNLLIRSSMCGHPHPFRSVRDLGRNPGRCSCQSGEPEGRSFVWLPAWLPEVSTGSRCSASGRRATR